MNRKTSSSVVLIVALGAHAALAAERHGAHTEPTISTLFLPLVNFALFAALFARYVWPMLRGALAERRVAVQKELAEADQERKAAEALLADIEARSARLREDGERMVREMRAEAERERATLIEAARQSAERIRTDAHLLGEQESSRAAQTIREEVAARVVAEVVKALREKITEDDERRFLGDFVSTVQQGAVE